MTAQYKITVDLAPVLNMLQQQAETLLGRVAETVQTFGEAATVQWKDAVMQSRGIWLGEKKAYAESIQWYNSGPFEVTVEAGYAKAGEIETGRPARDLKDALKTSLRVRIAKKGKHKGMRYLIIPFRHNTPGNDALADAMPDHVYEVASQMKQSRITGTRIVANQQGAVKNGFPVMIHRNKYKWGDKLPSGLTAKKKDYHATDPYAGMVRMKTNASNSPTSSAYLTFRVMGEWSSGWIIAPQPGRYIAKGVADKLGPKFDSAIQKALEMGG
jgi:hypothetical protein